MPGPAAFDAVVVGSGPNGLAAAITIAEAGRTVCVLEAAPTPGGGARSAQLIEPGVVHDVCSAVHPLAMASPFFRRQDLARHGLTFVQPEIPVAHPLDGRPAAIGHRSLDRTASAFGADGARYRRLVGPSVARFHALADDVLAPVLHKPRHPVTLARFGIPALAPAAALARLFRDDATRALFAGCAAHAIRPLTAPLTSSFGILLLAAAHAEGWPLPVGGSQAITDALLSRLSELGGTIECNRHVRTLGDLPRCRAVLFDIDPHQTAEIAADALGRRFRRALTRFRHGPGVCKVDYVLDEPVPWTEDEVRRAGTVHVGGTLDEIAEAEAEVWRGRAPTRPFVLASQPTLFDPTRAPPGTHVLWAYCHAPSGSDADLSPAIDRQIERFAPGFADVVRHRHVTTAVGIERYNAAYRGGDIATGAHSVRQLVFRPVVGRAYRTPNDAFFLCSAATPPGGGVHGMCGYLAARAALAGALK